MNASPRAREHPPHRGHDSVARTNQSPKNKIARSHIPVQTGQSSHPCRLPAFPLCVLPSMGAGHAPCTRPYIFPPSLPFPGLDATVLADPRHSFRAASLRAASVRLSLRAGVVPVHHDRRHAGRDPSCWSAPWYGCRNCPPGRFRRGCRPGPHRHPSSIPFDRCCPYPLHPCQVLDPEERSVLSPVRDDRLGLVRPHVRQSLLQRRRICRIDVDAVGRQSGSGQQQSQRKRLPRNPRPHRVAPCDPEPTPAVIPSEQSVSLATYT